MWGSFEFLWFEEVFGLTCVFDDFLQIPTEVTDPESSLYNRGSCWIMGGKLSIAQAFAEQSKSDFQKFLHCRKVELASGGILFCYMSGRTDFPDPTNQTKPERRHRFLAGPDFEDTWEDLIAEVSIRNILNPISSTNWNCCWFCKFFSNALALLQLKDSMLFCSPNWICCWSFANALDSFWKAPSCFALQMIFVEFGNCSVIALAFLRRFCIKTDGYANSLQMALNSSEVFHLGFALQIEFVDLGNCFAIALGFF